MGRAILVLGVFAALWYILPRLPEPWRSYIADEDAPTPSK